MDQIKIGNFIKELRKESGLTQEQFAEQFAVSRRSVSRWETGSNLPDLDILVELSDFCHVDLRDLLDGERKCDQLNDDTDEAVRKAAAYSRAEKGRTAKVVTIYFVVGIVALILNSILYWADLPETFWVGFAEGATFGMALAAMIMGLLYSTGLLYKFAVSKKKLLPK